MDELQKRGGKLIYDPDLVVYRRPRPTLKTFCKMLMTYGRGRAEQFRLHPSLGSALNFVPPLFLVFLITFIVAALLRAPSPWLSLGSWLLCAYLVALVVQTLASATQHGFLRSALALPLLFGTHFFYGLGFWRGLFTRVNHSNRAATEVTLDRVTLD
jgi:fucose 4-O-acetylase-like acetyltransferase